MAGDIEYFYSVRSIYAYFGASRIVGLAKRSGRRLVHRPVDLSKVVPAFGSVWFLDRPPAHTAYHFGREIERWSEYLGIPALVDPKHHYGDRALPSGLVLAAQEAGANVDALHEAVLAALWRDDRDIADPAILAGLCRASGIADPAPLLARAMEPAIQAAFEACSARAIEARVPGSPTYLIDGELFYGQDRLMMVERHLERPFRRA